VDGKHVVGYRQEDRVDPESNTGTFGAIRIEIDNWRRAGVPFYLRAGKRLEKRLTESASSSNNRQRIFSRTIQVAKDWSRTFSRYAFSPMKEFHTKFGAKVPGLTTNVSQVDMRFSYADAFGKTSANGYPRRSTMCKPRPFQRLSSRLMSLYFI